MSGLLISSLYQSVYLDITIKGKFKIFSILSVSGQVLKSLLIVKVNSVSKVTFFWFYQHHNKNNGSWYKTIINGSVRS